MSVEEIKEKFLNFFKKNDHRFVNPSGILPKGDPTLLFINSGMAPMKPYFLGASTAPYPKLTNIQDCIRTVDIDDVGDSYHGSSFRMMGSWSFGDYFKEKAIELAFTLITEGFGFPADRLYATVMKSDHSLPNVPDDEESAKIWKKFLPSDHIIWCPPSDNFWGPAGESGPCGPCTEVFYDRGPEYGDKNSKDQLVRERHIEIWNAGVFMQYIKSSAGAISQLPMHCVDTGAGLERFAMLLQDAPSIHEIDQYKQVYDKIVGYTKNHKNSRIILDHAKTSLLMMSEGVSPGNQRHAYVLRRLLRRILTLHHLDNIELKNIIGIMEMLAKTMDNSSNIIAAMPFIGSIMQSEVGSFERIIARAEKHFSKIIKERTILASYAFELKTAHGIPTELIQEFCKKNNINFPENQFSELLKKHRDISR